MFKEFREFAVKGNAIDLAVGVIIGAAFGKIVDSLVKDLLMPPLGKLIGGIDFSNFFVVLGAGDYATLKAAQDAGVATLNYGLFVNAIVNFVIIAFSLFLVLRPLNRMRRAPAPVTPTTKECGFCAMVIPLKATRCPHCTSNV